MQDIPNDDASNGHEPEPSGWGGCLWRLVVFVIAPYSFARALGETHEAAGGWAFIGLIIGVLTTIMGVSIASEHLELEQQGQLKESDSTPSGAPSLRFTATYVALFAASWAVLIGIWFIPGVKELFAIGYSIVLTLVAVVLIFAAVAKLLSE